MEKLLELRELLIGGNISDALLLVEEMTEMSKDDKLNNSPYAEFPKTFTPSPSPIKGKGNQKTNLAPLLPSWEKGLGDEGDYFRSA